MLETIKFIRYQGSKQHFINKFNEITYNLDSKVYIEPFLGSGAIFFNLQKEYEHYILNDLNKDIISIYESFKYLTYNDYEDVKNYIFTTFGDIKNIKESFYNFRNYYNEYYHFTSKIEKGFYLYFLANSCINSMLRFGPNGMNSSFGNRLYYIDNESIYNYIHSKLNRADLYSKDYIEVLKYSNNDSLIFLDPPYFTRPASYSNNFDKNDFIELLDIIKESKSNIIYTDIENIQIDEYLKWNKINTKVITNTSPGKLKDKYQEVAYFNFDVKDEW